MSWQNQWHSAADFFAMGGYGFYVWGSFLACALLMTLEPLLARLRLRRALRDITREQYAASLDHTTEQRNKDTLAS
jgi:heme exporter protein D